MASGFFTIYLFHVNIEKSSLLSRPLLHSPTLSTRYRRFGGEFHINQCILSNQASLSELFGDLPCYHLLNIAYSCDSNYHELTSAIVHIYTYSGTFIQGTPSGPREVSLE